MSNTTSFNSIALARSDSDHTAAISDHLPSSSHDVTEKPRHKDYYRKDGSITPAQSQASDEDAQSIRTVGRNKTVLSQIRTRPSVLAFTHSLADQKTTIDQLVGFEGLDDKYNPINWPLRKKVITTVVYSLVTMSATWNSSSYSSGTQQIAEQYRVSTEVATLGTSLFLLGFGLGPVLWAPLSEVFGRRVAVFTPMVVAICFTFGSATAKDFQTLMLTRFFAAFFSSAPLTNTGGVLGDLFSPAQRGLAMAIYACAVVIGPCCAPIISTAFVSRPDLGWRWAEYFTGILQSVVLIIALVFIDESYPPLLLSQKARRLRYASGNWALHAKSEEQDVTIKALASKFLIRPMQLLRTPICLLMATYSSFCYGILYMQLGAIPIIFAEQRHWPAVSSQLPFLALAIGALVGVGINVLNQLRYNRSYHAAGDRAIPEQRLPPMMIGSILFAVGQYITGWTASPHDAPWIAPVIGLVLLGIGFSTIFQSTLNYLVDTFPLYAASAVAANTLMRSCFAAALPLVVIPLYTKIGIGPGTTIFAGAATLLIPVPFLFHLFGRRIRKASEWSVDSVF